MKYYREILFCVVILFGIINLFFDISKYLLLFNILYMIYIFIQSHYDYKNNKTVNASYSYYLCYYCLPVILINILLFGFMALGIKYVEYFYIVIILISIMIMAFLEKNRKNRIY